MATHRLACRTKFSNNSQNIAKISLIIYVALLFACPILTYIVNIFYHYTMSKLGHKLSFELRENYIGHLFDMDAELYEKYTKGDLISRATNDLNSLTMLATSFLENVI